MAAVVNDGMPHGTSTGNPAANKASGLIDIEWSKTWIMAVELMEQTLSEKSRKYVELRRDAAHQLKNRNKPGPIGWVDYVQPRYVEWFCYRYGREINPPTKQAMTAWMNKIVYTANIARYEILLRGNIFK
ncbi:hypothetical protein Ga0466249_002262 [Sporomusaceae bacterium BoRhaA]|uniref:hypothetical protein n=1 Tax=Pelorhabdus rhamnosifermentans TaxID=2772457 RepID=UPI001C05FB51|nr:hypothetical protein [Pelorhabdus rhamnosifermentans]MBU2701148.1 hypothetical protein [Pelorhabdus rhamnosifermentans]